MTPAQFLHSMSVQLAWQDGRENGVNGMLAILFCLRNRVAEGFEGGDLSRIIQSHHIWRYSEGLAFIDVPDTREPSFSQLLGYVEGVFDNSIVDRLTAGATYWGKFQIKKMKVAQVGTLDLWKDNVIQTA